MPQIYLGPRPEPRTISRLTPSAGGGLALEDLTYRRWPLWVARLGFWALLLRLPSSCFRRRVTRRGGSSCPCPSSPSARPASSSSCGPTRPSTRPRSRPGPSLMRAAMNACGLLRVRLDVPSRLPGRPHPRPRQDAGPSAALFPECSATPPGWPSTTTMWPRCPVSPARMTGVSQAPIGLVFLGSGRDLLEAFAQAGWHAAERITPRTALRAFGRGVMNRPYHCAPVFPSFLDGQPARRRLPADHSRWLVPQAASRPLVAHRLHLRGQDRSGWPPPRTTRVWASAGSSRCPSITSIPISTPSGTTSPAR